ncbi:MAG TPA: hypothetical protein VMH39_09225, partial [Gemmatimonadaceae bacterium]|nr:hypothetical protein [Gemmatimonadaceae bacterium]
MITPVVGPPPASSGANGVYLIPYRGDTTVVIDATSDSLFLLPPDGMRCCSTRLPSAEVRSMGELAGTRIFARAGAITYGEVSGAMPVGGYMSIPGGHRTALGGGVVMFGAPAPVVRLNVETLAIDTLAWVNTGMSYRRVDSTTGRESTLINPFQPVDTWAVLSDGALAIVRGADAHIDWVRPAGERDSTPSIGQSRTFLTQSEKARLADSALANPIWHFMFVEKDSFPGRPRRHELTLPIVPPQLIPDYRPYFPGNSALADLDDNLWLPAG